MKCLTQSETEIWIREHIGEDILNLKTMDVLVVPNDAGRKMSLSKHIFASIRWDEGGVLLVTNHGIWPSSENMLLFDGYRRSLGEDRSLDTAPGHLIEQDSKEQVEVILALGLYFMWDMLLISLADKLLIQLDHHERMGLAGTNLESLSKISKLMDNYLS
jgi:hypothetical protein